MPKPIVLTEEVIQEMAQSFARKLRTAKLSDGKLTYTQQFSYETDEGVKAHIVFTPEAYVKMVTLIYKYDSEVAWHGTVNRLAEDCFLITDILVYPQEVTGTTVNTDQDKYQQWIMEIDGEVFDKLHMQGHSHVTMQTSPSVTDLTHQEAILSQLDEDRFYIFMIWNKRMEHNIKIYDMASNTLYEDSDIVVTVQSDGCNLDQFLKDASAAVVKKYGSSNYGYGGSNYGGSSYGGSSYGGSSYGGTASKAGATTPAPKNAGLKPINGGKGKSGKKKGAQEPDLLDLPGYNRAGYDDDDIDYDAMIFGQRT